jgi:hypothetical protein
MSYTINQYNKSIVQNGSEQTGWKRLLKAAKYHKPEKGDLNLYSEKLGLMGWLDKEGIIVAASTYARPIKEIQFVADVVKYEGTILLLNTQDKVIQLEDSTIVGVEDDEMYNKLIGKDNE